MVRKETTFQRKRRLEKERRKRQEKIDNESAEDKQTRLEKRRETRQKKIHGDVNISIDSTQKQKDKLEHDRTYRSERREAETPLQREKRLELDRSNHAQAREAENSSQRAQRLEQDRLHHSQIRQAITPERHEVILAERRRKNADKVAKLKADVETFEKTIYTFCDQACEICKKLCYPSQISKCTPAVTANSYLPEELKTKNILMLCYRCKTHVSSKKTLPPSKAYWNQLDPGLQPDVLKNLTQPEQRMLSRILPFVKIVKFDGRFGQFGFRGQAILFAQDIFEVSEKLPNMLPRSSSSTGIVVVTENLQDLNIMREFSISRPRVYAALQWLITNNPLYKDVSIDHEVHLNEQDFMRLAEPTLSQKNGNQQTQKNAYKQINDISRIVRGSWHQGNDELFSQTSKDVQCCAIAMASIVRARISSPQTWNTNILDMNMMEGDRIYRNIVNLTNNNPSQVHPIGERKFLEMKNFDVIKDNFSIFDKTFTIAYDDITKQFENIDKFKNKKERFAALNEGLNKLFNECEAGILISAGESIGVMHYNDKFYYVDSHSCGAKGARTRTKNGKACIIECDSITELQRLCRRSIASKNDTFSLNYVRVHGNDNDNPEVVEPAANEHTNQKQNAEQVTNDHINQEQNAINNGDSQNTNPDLLLHCRNDFIPISNLSRIVRATFNQGNSDFFTSGYAGVQCCAMALANLVKAHIYPPRRWSTDTLDENLLEGDRIYAEIRMLSDISPEAYPVHGDGFLEVKHFDVIKEDFVMYNTNFNIEYENDTQLFGNLRDELNDPDIGMTFNEALTSLFSAHQAGILITGSKSYGIMYHNEKFYFTDSHSCGPKGASTKVNNNGRACVIECDTIAELQRICRRATGYINCQFTVNYIQIRVKHDPVLDGTRNRVDREINLLSRHSENIQVMPKQLQETRNRIDGEVDLRSVHSENIQVIPEQPVEIRDKSVQIDVPTDGNRVPFEEQLQSEPAKNIQHSDCNATPQEQSQNIPIQTSVMAPNDYRQPDVEEEFEVSEHINEIVRKTKDNIVNVEHELKAEEFGWFYLFPYGVNGLKEPSRPVKISPLDYFQYRVLGNDTRFQRNDYLFYALSMFEYERVKNTISACGKKIEGENGMIDDVHLYLKNLRGSAAYWRTALNELLAQIRCLGPPHYFMTFSCNDIHWLDMRKALLIADKRPDYDPKLLTVNEVQHLIESYPVIVSRHFMNRVNALMKFILNNDNVFGGKLIDFWWRIEFQNRGSPHLHMVVWIENHPSFDTEEGLQRIDENCTCELPPEDSDLYELVKMCQTHYHTQTCKKNNCSVCRFGFPRQECSETRLVAHSSDDFIRSGGRICLLKRGKKDKWINNYHRALLKMWKANMDIQPCGSNEAIAFYIGKYLSKSEPTELNPGIARAIKQIRNEENDTSRKIFRICMKILQQRQVSACECVYRLGHLYLRNSSRKCVFLNTRKPEQRYRVLKFDPSGRATGYFDNIFERYQKRPNEHREFDFNNMSLLEFAMRFEPYYKAQNNSEDPVDEHYMHDDNNNKNQLITLTDKSKMIVRKKLAVVRVPYFKVSEDPENYYYSLLLQYFPFRNESDIIGEYNDAREAFLAREEQIKQVNKQMEVFRNRDQQLENAFNQIHAFEILNNDPLLDNNDDEEVDALDRPMDDNQFVQAQRAMNVGQKEIFTYVTQNIQEQIMNGSQNRLRLFITGNAGTGKSFTLHLLKNQINRCFGKNVTKICALTGVAARLIGGSTLHSTLKLPVQKDGRILQMPLLTGIFLRHMRLEWKDVEFFFIDEISMVPYEMLCMIDSRLKQLKNCEDFFGGINVILFGDLMQLPPVRGNQVFHQPDHLEPATHLWRLFSLVELTENMRQQGSTTFIDILNALRIGQLTTTHISELMKRVNTQEEGEFSIEKALRIYPTNDQVFRHNQKVLDHFKSKGIKMIRIKAQDQLIDATRKTDDIQLEDIIPTDINKTGGMPKELEIFVGAKIMLRSNIDVSKGLVNGAIGFIIEIKWPNFRREQMYETDLPSVRVDFGSDGIHQIIPKSIQFPAKYSFGTIERRMLPIVLSWASTVHKMQGSTVDHAVVYLGSKIFAEGQAYVALSRVRSLDGLQIEELDSTKITGKKPCNNDALAEMERMRKQRNA